VEVIERARCSVCGDRLGVYEAVVALGVPSGGRTTSLALEPWLENRGTTLVHVACAKIKEIPVQPLGSASSLPPASGAARSSGPGPLIAEVLMLYGACCSLVPSLGPFGLVPDAGARREVNAV
jgi:hypothetical protein